MSKPTERAERLTSSETTGSEFTRSNGEGPDQTHPSRGRSGKARLRAGAAGAAALVVLGVTSILVGVSFDDERLPAVGPNLPVNTGAASSLDIRAHNSPAVAQSPVNPAVLAAVNRVDTPRYSCSLHISVDGAASWNEGSLPFPAGEEDPPRCYAPDAVFDSAGNLHVSFVTLAGAGNTPNALWIASSGDGGQRFSDPVRVAGPLTFQARLTTDPAVKNRVYISWLQAANTGNLLFPEAGYPVVVSRSDDGGRTWQVPVRVSSTERGRVVAPSIAAGKRALYVSYLDLRGDVLDYHGAHQGMGGEPYGGNWSLVVARSVDGGRTWQEVVVDDAIVPTERFIVFLPPVPSLVVDRHRGNVFVGFHDGRRGDADVWVWTSRDSGRTFGPGVRVNDTRSGDGTAQYLPEVALAPDGRLDVLYYDRRDDRANLFNVASLQSSTDGGRSFGPRVKLAEKAFDSRVGLGNLRGMPDLGSRLALISTDDRALAIWTDTRSGTELTNKQDIAQAIVTFPEDSSAKALLVALGIVLALAGMAVVIVRAARARTGEHAP